MRLVTDHSLAAGNVSVACYRDDCHGERRMLRLADALIDIEGPAFQAYYHKECVAGTAAPCETFGCARDHSRNATREL